MPGVAAVTTTKTTHLFWSKTITTFTRTNDVIPYTEVLGTGKLIINASPKDATNVNRVKDARDIGSQGASGNPIEYPIYGEDTQERVAGPASSVDFSFSFNPDRTDTVHKAIMDSDVGTKCVAAVMRRTAATAITITAMEGEISAKEQGTPTGDTTQFTVTIALSKAPVHVDHTT